MQNQSCPSTHPQPASEYLALITDLARMIAAEGCATAARCDDTLYFLALDEPNQVQTVAALRRYVEVCRNTLDAGHSLRSNIEMAKRMLHSLQFAPPPSLIERLEGSDVIEIYDSNNLQIFRDFYFFSICSYSLDEILCRPWYELYEREKAITEKLQEVVTKVLSSGETAFLDMPAHILREIAGRQCYHAVIRIRFIAPLRSAQNQVCAYLAATKILSHGNSQCEPNGDSIEGVSDTIG